VLWYPLVSRLSSIGSCVLGSRTSSSAMSEANRSKKFGVVFFRDPLGWLPLNYKVVKFLNSVRSCMFIATRRVSTPKIPPVSYRWFLSFNLPAGLVENETPQASASWFNFTEPEHATCFRFVVQFSAFSAPSATPRLFEHAAAPSRKAYCIIA
jgi:hypothetical protein